MAGMTQQIKRLGAPVRSLYGSRCGVTRLEQADRGEPLVKSHSGPQRPATALRECKHLYLALRSVDHARHKAIHALECAQDDIVVGIVRRRTHVRPEIVLRHGGCAIVNENQGFIARAYHVFEHCAARLGILIEQFEIVLLAATPGEDFLEWQAPEMFDDLRVKRPWFCDVRMRARSILARYHESGKTRRRIGQRHVEEARPQPAGSQHVPQTRLLDRPSVYLANATIGSALPEVEDAMPARIRAGEDRRPHQRSDVRRGTPELTPGTSVAQVLER